MRFSSIAHKNNKYPKASINTYLRLGSGNHAAGSNVCTVLRGIINPMVERMNDELSCVVCIEVCKGAVETGCCGHLLCEECARQLRSCPYCRAEPFQYNVSKSIRRMIDSMLVDCVCGAKVQRGNLSDHERSCPMKTYTCATPQCSFSGTYDNFLAHITSKHPNEAIKLFTAAETASGTAGPNRDCISAKGRARIGQTGKYYCGGRLNGSCGCCDGNCGPGNGCNCESCMKLDIEARALPKRYLVNREGRICRIGDTGKWYCGAKVMSGVPLCDGWCGPSNGPQCRACAIAQSQLTTRYANIVATWR